MAAKATQTPPLLIAVEWADLSGSWPTEGQASVVWLKLLTIVAPRFTSQHTAAAPARQAITEFWNHGKYGLRGRRGLSARSEPIDRFPLCPNCRSVQGVSALFEKPSNPNRHSLPPGNSIVFGRGLGDGSRVRPGMVSLPSVAHLRA
jgi:hypothetical protein